MESSLPDLFRRFFSWWKSELTALLPGNAFSSRNTAPRRFVIAIDGPRRRLLLERGARTEQLAESDEEGLGDFMRFIEEKPHLPVGIRLAARDCFARIVELPARAESNFGRILQLDMERTTPFRSADVLTAHHTAPDIPASAGKRAVKHLIVKRKSIEPLFQEMRMIGIEPAFADCWEGDGSKPAQVDFLLQPGSTRQPRGPQAAQVLAGLAIVLAISAAGIWTYRHQSTLEALERRTQMARAEADTVRRAVAASQTASAQLEAMTELMRNRLPVVRIIEELTVLIPDDAWVSDLRIDGETIELSGFARSAAALVPIMENSPLFREAGFMAPVIFDNAEGKERFSLRVRLNGSAVPADLQGASASPKAEADL